MCVMKPFVLNRLGRLVFPCNFLPARWNARSEDAIFKALFGLFRNRRHQAADLSAIPPTVKEALREPSHRSYHLSRHDPDYPAFTSQEIVDAWDDVPELEALLRW